MPSKKQTGISKRKKNQILEALFNNKYKDEKHLHTLIQDALKSKDALLIEQAVYQCKKKELTDYIELLVQASTEVECNDAYKCRSLVLETLCLFNYKDADFWLDWFEFSQENISYFYDPFISNNYQFIPAIMMTSATALANDNYPRLALLIIRMLYESNEDIQYKAIELTKSIDSNFCEIILTQKILANNSAEYIFAECLHTLFEVIPDHAKQFTEMYLKIHGYREGITLGLSFCRCEQAAELLIRLFHDLGQEHTKILCEALPASRTETALTFCCSLIEAKHDVAQQIIEQLLQIYTPTSSSGKMIETSINKSNRPEFLKLLTNWS